MRHPIQTGMLYLLLALFTFFSGDLQFLRLGGIGGYQVYVFDLFFVATLALFPWAAMAVRRRPDRAWWGYAAFLAWLLLAVLYGWSRFGWRAIGESRYMFPFLTVFIPLAMAARGKDDPQAASVLLRRAMVVMGVSSLLYLAVSLALGKALYFNPVLLELQKSWAEKIVNTLHTFHIAVLGCLLFVWGAFEKRPAWYRWAGVGCLAAAYITRNRAAFASVLLALLVLLLLRRRFGLAALAMASTAGIVLLVAGLEKAAPAVAGGKAVTSYYTVVPGKFDTTLDWRWQVQKAAVRQALDTPLLGQGFGGYFHFYIPRFHCFMDFPPHNQYLLVWLKAGLVGVALLLLLAVLLLSRGGAWSGGGVGRFLALLILVAQLPYGFFFDFVPAFGFTAGCLLLARGRAEGRRA